MMIRRALAIALTSGSVASAQCAWHQVATGSTDISETHLFYDASTSSIVGLVTTDAELAAIGTVRWIGASTTPVFGSGGLAYRNGPGITFDTDRHRMIIFGGVHQTESEPSPVFLEDTWEWNGGFINFAVPHPSPRAGPSMVYDPIRHITLMVGGSTFITPPPPPPGDFWSWDGAAWTHFPQPAPASGILAYDPDNSRIIMFVRTPAATDIWEWTGSVWNQLPSAPMTTFNSAAFDAGRHLWVILNNTGTWEGTVGGTWTLKGGRPPYFRSNLLYDPGRARVVAVVHTQDPYEGHLFAYEPDSPSIEPAFTVPLVPTQVFAGNPVSLHVGVLGNSPTFQWFKDGHLISDSPTLSGSQSDTITINPAWRTDFGLYKVVVSTPCGAITSPTVQLTVSQEPNPDCYPNCDYSTTPPILNVNDFLCFLNQFAIYNPYTNCDNSTSPPTLNVNDFMCFLNKYAAGCP